MRNFLAILTLALGIGAATAMFSLVHPMLLHPLLYPRADRLVVIEGRDSKGQRGISWPELRDVRRSRAFADAAAFEFGFFFLTGIEEPEQIAGALVTPNTFRMLGVAPLLGRDFRDGEDGVVVLSDACWKNRFGSDPNILGRSVALDLASTPQAERYTVIGVMPPNFWMYYSAFEVFVPLPRASMNEDRKARGLAVSARLRDGVTLEQARIAVDSIPREKDWTTSVRLWERSQTEDVRPAFLVLAGGAVLLLLIATANVAGLLLVSAQGRTREIAIRAALGASRWRLMRLMIGESLRLGIFASLAGVMLAWWGLRIMIASLPKGGLFSFLPSVDRVVIDLPALLFAIGVSMFVCVIAGIFPAVTARHAGPITGLKDGGSIESGTTRTILVTTEIALSVTLLVGAGLLMKTMARINAIDPGFRYDHLFALSAPLPRVSDRNRTAAYYGELEMRLASLPGIQSVALASSQPLMGMYRAETLQIPGRSDTLEADNRVVTPNYFGTLGIPIRKGRAFEAGDTHRAVVSESLARKYWNAESPIGKQIQVRGESIEIVGVCGDTLDVLLHEPAPTLYRPWRDDPERAQWIEIRTSGDSLALPQALHAVVRDLGGVVAGVYRGSQLIEDVTWQQRQAAGVLSVFAGLALVLALIGLYGVISLAIVRRTREIGIRVAVGAGPIDVVRLVAREGVGPLLAGLALGLAVSLAMGRLVSGMLYGVAPTDPLMLVLAVGAVTIGATLACLVPLWRALGVDPLIALRCE
jgi:putative ABC transport system permease protein